MAEPVVRDHGNDCVRFGWTALAFFALLGLGLESLHLIKAPVYMEVHIRRELWTLAHAHGVLLALVTIVFGLYRHRLGAHAGLDRASAALRTGALLIPGGFLLGGIGNAETDPSLAIVLVPLGALMVLYATAITALSARRTALHEPQPEPVARGRKKNGRHNQSKE